MVAPRALVLLHSRPPRTRVTPSLSLTAMIGKAVCWRSVKIGLLVHPVADTKVVGGSEVAWDVEAFEVALVVLEVAMGEATADVVATEVEVAMVVRLQAISMTLQHRTPSPITLHLAEK